MKKCIKCGKIILTDAARCCYCGVMQEMPEKIQQEKEETFEKAEKEEISAKAEKEEMSEKVEKEEIPAEIDAEDSPGTSEEQLYAGFCSNCGKKMKKGYRYCPECGRALINPYVVNWQTIKAVGEKAQEAAKNVAKDINTLAVQPLKEEVNDFVKKKKQEREERKNNRLEVKPVEKEADEKTEQNQEKPEKMQEEPEKTQEESEQKKEARPVMGALQEKVMQLSASSVFLVFCLFYTGNLLYQLFSRLSFIKWVGKIFSILLCVAIWQIYMNCKKNELDEDAFSLASSVMNAKYVVKIIMSIILCAVSILGGPLGLLVAIVTAIIDICYLGSLRKIAKSVKKVVEGKADSAEVSFYPMLVLGITVIRKSWTFLKALFLQGAANSVTGVMRQSGAAASSGLASLFGSFGLDYGYSYGQSSYLIQMLMSPIEDWIQGILGFGENPLVMFLAAAIPICEFMLLKRVRSWGK